MFRFEVVKVQMGDWIQHFQTSALLTSIYINFLLSCAVNFQFLCGVLWENVFLVDLTVVLFLCPDVGLQVNPVSCVVLVLFQSFMTSQKPLNLPFEL